MTPSYRLAARLAVLDERLKFAYFIPHPPQDLEDASPFGFYTPGLHESEGMLLAVCTLPADVREPFTSPARVLQLRLNRALWRHVIPIDVRSLRELAGTETPTPTPLFRVILTNKAEMADAMDSFSFADGVPFLHISSVAGPRRLPRQELGVDALLRFSHSVLAHLDQLPEWRGFVQWVRDAMPANKRYKGKAYSRGLAFHNVTLPNELALASFGWTFSSDDPLVPDGRTPPDTNRYIDRICSLADDVTAKRSALMRTCGLPASLCDWAYIVSCPSIHWGHYQSSRRGVERMVARNLRAARVVYEAAVKQSTYFDKFEGPADATREALESAPEYRALLTSRARDQRCYTAGLSLLASSTLAPVLRIEPKINRVRGNLKMLGASARIARAGSIQLKQSRLARVIGSRMRDLVDQKFLTRLDRYASRDFLQGMKLVADVPMEWLPIADLPMMLRYDVSRTPVLPGNLYLQHCIRLPVLLSASAFFEVLVVRSFNSDDRLKFILERAVKRVFESAGNATMRVTFRDVSNSTELIEAINDYRGAVLIFDCHGGYEDVNGVGTIVVGGQPMEVWNLRDRCHLPPIVIFSACDTHPLDGSHGSSANAAFVLGAVSVLGTMLPINAGLAAAFIGRLMLRISEFIPIALKVRNILTWREVISGMIRMAYTSEVRRILTTQAGLSLRSGGDDRVQLVANVAINERLTNWFELFVAAMATESDTPESQVRSDVLRWASLTDALKYVQLGCPENLVILPDVSPEETATLERTSAEYHAGSSERH